MDLKKGMLNVNLTSYFLHYQSERSLKWGVTIAIVSFILTLSYLPNMIWWQMELLDFSANYILLSMMTNTITVFNSCSNPVVYALRTASFKRATRRLLRSERSKREVHEVHYVRGYEISVIFLRERSLAPLH